ncbi:rhamnogalacturonyl hydrolase YesR [Haloferula luteola]|uniref:Rhamnogalacturonyl hydrolase YesR n=1 Tax=Haloferula luteola TaxID=595692 RepID=A0A840V192_9BACT|nr:glycoside hydrolase family 88 protein [Haloferula luteola]MBB5352117.1 rhamnogalacturonyl hydrolase YesR [Haloferula luteola]
MISRFLLPALLGLGLTSLTTAAEKIRSHEEVLKVLERVNDHWQETHPDHGNAFWNRAVYHVGNMEAYEVTQNPAYRSFSEAWARKNDWQGARSENPAEWRYDYGENDRHVLFGDWQVCFQVYFDLYGLEPQENKIKRAKEVFAYQITTEPRDYIWWSDGLFMIMPTMSELYQITGDPAYLTHLRTYFDYARDLMLDEDTGLFFRDAKYVYPKHKSAHGKKDFWARGNGWVFAALPKVIDDLPADHPDRPHYLAIYQAMASALASSQQDAGYWTRSILDPDHAPGPETSGTAFFTYGFLWGLRHGVLDAATYEPVAMKAWDFLMETSLQENGAVGYIQPIGEKAIPGQVVDAASTADFGVGAFLMAAAEMARYAEAH